MSIYIGRTPKEEYRQLIDMLDDVFFFDDGEVPKRDFLTLLPKLYKEENDPCHNNFCVMEDGVIKGTVGLFPIGAIAAGQPIKIGGIGNVAVSRDARRAGHMITCMNSSLEQMRSDGTDVSLLGGQRQRYGFFGYEPAGVAYHVGLDTGNLERLLGRDYPHPFTARPLTADDTAVMAEIERHFASFPFHVPHAPDKMFDILCSWRVKPYVAFENGVCKGFFAVGRNGGLHELYPFAAQDALSLCIAAMDVIGTDRVGFRIPAYNTALCEFCAAKMGGMGVEHVEMLNILCYERFLRGFLGVRAAYESLCDGQIVLLLHGYNRDEQLYIEVKDNRVTVEPTTRTPDMEIGHHEAVRMIASLCSRDRLALPPNVRSWFPLPFFFSSHDSV